MRRSSRTVLTLLIFLQLSFPVWAQFTEVPEFAVEEPEATEYIDVDLHSSENNNETYYEKVEIDPSFKDAYKGSVYDYDRPEKEPKPKERIERKPLFTLSAAAMKVILFVLLGGIVLVIAYFILKNAGGFHFGSGRRNIDVKAGARMAGEDTEDIDNNDFESLIRRAKAEKDFRKAVRFYYLLVLQKLSDHKLIQWDKDKTDYDYYLELSAEDIREDFSGNAYVFDHIWYGNFEISEKEFALAENLFHRTLNKLK